MPPPRRPAPRKIPRSPAGLAIRDAILGAAERILQESSIEKLSTNLVAERAGVSVGSLYQYFPDKDAILVALAQRLETRTGELIVRAIDETEAEPLDVLIGRIVDILLGQLGSLVTRQTLRHEVPAAWTAADATRVDTEVRANVARALSLRSDVRRGPPEVMTWIVSHAVEMVVESVVIGAPEMLGSDVFRTELIELAVRYLRA